MVRLTGYERQLSLIRAREYGNQPIKTTKIPYVQLNAMIEAAIPVNRTSMKLPLNEETGEELTIYDYILDEGT